VGAGAVAAAQPAAMTAADLRGTATGSVARVGVRDEAVVVDVTERSQSACPRRMAMEAGKPSLERTLRISHHHTA